MIPEINTDIALVLLGQYLAPMSRSSSKIECEVELDEVVQLLTKHKKWKWNIDEAALTKGLLAIINPPRDDYAGFCRTCAIEVGEWDTSVGKVDMTGYLITIKYELREVAKA